MRGKVFAISSAIWGFTRRWLQSATAEWRRSGWLPLWRPSRPAAMPPVPPGPRWCRDTRAIPTDITDRHERRNVQCLCSCSAVFENKTKKRSTEFERPIWSFVVFFQRQEWAQSRVRREIWKWLDRWRRYCRFERAGIGWHRTAAPVPPP